MLMLETAGPNSFDVFTDRGSFAGLIAHRPASNTYRVFFDSNGTKGSARKFPTVAAAVDFIVDRRMKNGWRV